MRFLYYPLFLSLVACSQLVTPPKKLLSESDMEAVFYDLAILNAAKNIDAFSFEKKHPLRREEKKEWMCLLLFTKNIK